MYKLNKLIFFYFQVVIISIIYCDDLNLNKAFLPSLNNVNGNDYNGRNIFIGEAIGFYRKTPSISNLTVIIGETVQFNCSLSANDQPPFGKSASKFNSMHSSTPLASSSSFSFSADFKLNPTWLKADPIYSQNGFVDGYKTENIIVTRKGIIADNLRDKMKLITPASNDQLQILKIANVNIRNEGKYICREFNSQFDKQFYLNVFASVSGLSMKFYSSSKYFRALHSGTNDLINSNQREDENTNNIQKYYSNDNDFEDDSQNFVIKKNSGSNNVNHKNPLDKSLNFPNGLASSISIKENDELIVNCTVNSSKPAANISIWIVANHRTAGDDESRKLDIYDFHTFKNRDLTLKSTAVAKFNVNRLDNLKSVTCIAENTALDEKWESKRVINVLYSPKCSKHQKLIYYTGINQTVELECRMSDANPPYLDFSWHFTNNQGNKEKMQSNGFISRISWMPRSENDFGEVSCSASNGLDIGECKMQLVLGGSPNPPEECYHKENNRTIIIECKPGFDQGDPEVYFYLLKKKANGVLVEYARKRDSCSFLISNMILEEHLNEFFVYSSNKYGNNRDQSTKIIIENKELIERDSKKLTDLSTESSKRFKYVMAIIGASLFGFIFLCCLIVRCKNSSSSSSISSIEKNAKMTYHNNHQNYNYEHGNSIGSHYHYNPPNLNNKHHSSNGNLTLTSLKSNGHLQNGTLKSANGTLNKNQFVYQDPSKYQPQYTVKSKYYDESTLKKLDYTEDKSNYANGNYSSTSTEYDQDDSNNPLYDTSSLSKNKKSSVYGKVTKITNSKKAAANILLNNLKPNSNSLRSPSLLNNIQDLDMSPRTKRRSTEKLKQLCRYGNNGSLVDETTETDSENYCEFNDTKSKANNYGNDHKLDYDNPLHTFTTTSTSLAVSSLQSNANQTNKYPHQMQQMLSPNNDNDPNSNGILSNNYNSKSTSIQKVNLWYTNGNGILDDLEERDRFALNEIDNLKLNGDHKSNGGDLNGIDHLTHSNFKTNGKMDSIEKFDYSGYLSNSLKLNTINLDVFDSNYNDVNLNSFDSALDYLDSNNDSYFNNANLNENYINSNQNDDIKLDEWPSYDKNDDDRDYNRNLANNHDVSLDVDDDRMVGILV